MVLTVTCMYSWIKHIDSVTTNACWRVATLRVVRICFLNISGIFCEYGSNCKAKPRYRLCPSPYSQKMIEEFAEWPPPMRSWAILRPAFAAAIAILFNWLYLVLDMLTDSFFQENISLWKLVGNYVTVSFFGSYRAHFLEYSGDSFVSQ